MKISRILFVEPPRNYWFVMGEYCPPPTTLLILAAFIEKEIPDIEIKVLDSQAEQISWDEIERRIESYNPSMVLTSGFTCNTYTCARTVEIAKKINPDIITVVGGIHFTSVPDESLIDFPEIDYIVRGEGEHTVVELIKSFNNGKKISDIKGLSFKNNGKIIHTPSRPLINNLDKLPYPAYHLIEDYLKKYHFSMMAGKKTRYMILEGARGCNHRCTFCTQWNHWGGMWRSKSVKRIADEIEHFNETYGGMFLWLTDDHFKIKKRGKKLYEELRYRKCKEDIMLFLQARTDDVAKNPDLVKKLRSIGTHWIMCGVETPMEETLKEFKKGTKNKDAYDTMKLLRENDIFSHAMFVLGARRDTHRSIEILRRFSIDIEPDFSIYTALTPFPGTVYYETAWKNGWIEDTNYSNYDMAHAIMPTEKLTRIEVQEELWKCYQEFYGSYSKNIAGLFSKNKLKRTLYRHMAGQHVLRKFRRLI
ncbi:MAG: cobalamin-dependent protein [Thermoplasmatales archaeon]|nr:MAG: cobalamin-dependent protein [Thermoplasmatales archaeon]